jgi:hypothetical protein
VTVDLFAGGAASGSPVQSVVAQRDASGSFSARFGRVGGGTYTVRARQADAAGNTGHSGAMSFQAAGPSASGPPDFAVLATEESLADAAAGRAAALTGCVGGCRRTTALTASARAAARLGLSRRSLRLGGGSKPAGVGGVGVRLTRSARTALRRSRGATATLRVVSGSVSLARAVALRPAVSPSRLASRGLRLAGACSAACTIDARLIVSAATARRLGIRTSGRSVAIGNGRVSTATGAARSLTARIARSARAALSRARGADLTLAVRVSAPGTATRRATRRITLG